mmetsp:Transcript_7686/g.24647  ORF Transcript_7686/g.24647 Transcript_7686/m.24647 type:complete len:242 (+) Transcript_7686:291-1016(+)
MRGGSVALLKAMAHEVPLPPQTPHASFSSPYARPSQGETHSFRPLQSPHASYTAPEKRTPSHPMHAFQKGESASRHDPQSSSTLSLPGEQKHSFVPPQTPQLSRTALPPKGYGSPSHPMQAPVPPHTPHASKAVALPMRYFSPSQPTHALFPLQTPHASSSARLFATLSQPRQSVPSPSQTPHTSTVSHSNAHSLKPPQTPQLSTTLPELGTLSQPRHRLLPSHAPHWSHEAPPFAVPAQS